jgi:integrase
MMKARRKTSLTLYGTYIAKWKVFCDNHSWNHVYASVQQGLIFLQHLLDAGSGYSVINTARSALSALINLKTGIQFGSHPDVTLFMKGVFNIRPTTPKYVSTWDPVHVLTFLEQWFPADNITLEKLTLKLIMLILLVTGQRPQIIHRLDLANLKTTTDTHEFVVKLTDLKQGRVNYRPDSIVLRAYPSNKKLCVFRYMSSYIQRTALLRKNDTQLILAFKKPHKPASSNTISRWIKTVLNKAGIDTGTFSAGSVRSASTSKAREQGAPVQQILSMGGWTRESTFNKFYNRPIVSMPFATRILDCLPE